MRSAVATRRQFLAAGGVALAGAVLSRSIAAQAQKFPSRSGGGQGGGSTPLASPSPSGGGKGGGSTASATTRVPLGTWTAWDGTQVRYSFAEHSVTLSGVSPTEVRGNDVLKASQYWVGKTLFEPNFADFNNMAVIFQ